MRQKALEQFRRLNQELRESADKANTFSNITMPVNMSLGNISYVLCAVAGAIFALNGYLGFDTWNAAFLSHPEQEFHSAG